MTADLETLVVAAYCFASLLPSPRRRGRRARVSEAELVALAVAQSAMGICSDRQFLGLVRFRLAGWFPRLPEQTQYNRRLRELAPVLVWVQQRLSELLATGRLRLADGTLDRGGQRRRLRPAQRVRRCRRLRLLPGQERVGVGRAPRAARRP